MIKVIFTQQSGLLQLQLVGHADREICCSASMLATAAAFGLRDLAKQFPKSITFTALVDGKLNPDIDSTDTRKIKPRREK